VDEPWPWIGIEFGQVALDLSHRHAAGNAFTCASNSWMRSSRPAIAGGRHHDKLAGRPAGAQRVNDAWHSGKFLAQIG